MATYKHLRSSTANKRPTTSIADGQLAINTNTASPGLFFKDSAGTGIVKVGPVHVGTTAPNSSPAGSSGNYVGEQWLDTSLSPAQMKVWNGSAWIGVVADELPVSKLQDGAPRQLVQTDAAGTGVEWTSNIDVPGTLDVTGATTLDSTLTVPLGSAAAPTLRFSGDANSGLYSPGADQVAISTNGTGRLFVDASGNVGIGTSDTANAFVTLTKQDASLRLNPVTGAASITAVQTGVAFRDLTIGSNETIFQTSSLERMRLDSSGRLGIGTTDVSSLFSSNRNVKLSNTSGKVSYEAIVLDGTNNHRVGLFVDNGTGDLGLDTGSSSGIYNGLSFYIEGLKKATIDRAGRLLVGTASQAGGSLLQVNDNRIRIATAKTPSSASDTGTAGEICWDADYIYVCTATNTWKRTAISTWP
jgi:hypothetical protein